MMRLAWRNLRKHPVRALLTIGSMAVAVFLLCTLISLITTLEAGVKQAGTRRLWIQSAVSLFVDLPTSYESKIQAVDGVARVAKWQWFGGYYQERSNFFAQFAVDPAKLFELWPELEIANGTKESFVGRRDTCVIGQGLADEYGWKVGDVIPIIGGLFAKPDESSWDFEVAAVYRSTKATVDDRTLFFHWENFYETMKSITGTPPNVGVFIVERTPEAEPTSIMATIDGMFENGPQRVQTTTEAEFNLQFVSMIGNLPRFIAFIGAGVLIAIVLATVNTMLMAAREQTHEIGILKALGFADRSVFWYFLGQAVLLCAIGGGIGLAIVQVTSPGLAASMASAFPGYKVLASTYATAGLVALAVGLVAGVIPAWQSSHLNSVNALRAEN